MCVVNIIMQSLWPQDGAGQVFTLILSHHSDHIFSD